MLDANQINPEMNQLIAAKQFKEIAKGAEKLIEAYPDNYLGYWWKARASTFMGDTDLALHWFIEAMKKSENDHEESKISSSMANVCNIRKDWENSLNYTEIALELNQENVVAIIAKSIALVATGRKKEAYQLLDRNNKHFKEDYQKACVAAVKKDKQKMLKYLGKAIKENPHTRVTVLHDPDFAIYRRDPEFRSLLKV
jgi:tetratricopeptide (TPR) repeat protein